MSADMNKSLDPFNQGSIEHRAREINAADIRRLKEIANNPLLDSVTRAEYQAAVAEGTATGRLTSQGYSLLGAGQSAIGGQGLFGIRRQNEELAKLLLEKPGSKQTLLSVNLPNQPGSVTQTNLLGS
jgi:hypothetical protein